jgi:hypothetical protein
MSTVASRAWRRVLAVNSIACQFLLVVSYFVFEKELYLHVRVLPTGHKIATS